MKTGSMLDPKAGGYARLTLWQTLRELGFFSIFLMGLGGLSIIDILQKAVALDLTLITPFQYVLDGYRVVTALIGGVFEPWIVRLIDWINARLPLHWHLHEHWRSLFVLGLIWVSSFGRWLWRFGSRRNAAIMGSVMAVGALLGAAVSGLLSPDGAWWIQGLAAAVPVAILGVTYGSAAWLSSRYFGGERRWESAHLTWTGTALAFVVGAALSQVPSLQSGAGLLALGAIVIAKALRETPRIRLSMLGGFVAAALILLSNWAIALMA